jgi:cysteine desulfurase/selenocysteine lyase
MLCESVGAVLRVVPINDAGELLIDEYAKLLNERTKFVAITYISNSLGTINPIKTIIAMAHRYGAATLVDAAQAAPHMPLDVQQLDCEFLVFSGHKVFGPTGIGVLYGKEALLNSMPPYQGGGDMIERVTYERTTYNALPYKFEAGTPHISGAIGLATAIEYISDFGLHVLKNHEDDLLRYATEAVSGINGLRLVGTARDKASILSFVVEGAHFNDIGMLLDAQGIAVRTGHHCTQPLMDRFALTGTARASFAFYNTRAEIDVFVAALHKAITMLT